MAANQIPIFQKNPTVACQTIADTDGTAVKTLFTAGAEGALIDNISVTSTDTSAAIIVITVNDGTTDCVIGELSIPAGSGTNGTAPAVNLLDSTALPFLQSGGGLPLGATDVLKINAKATLTAATVLNIVAFGGDY